MRTRDSRASLDLLRYETPKPRSPGESLRWCQRRVRVGPKGLLSLAVLVLARGSRGGGFTHSYFRCHATGDAVSGARASHATASNVRRGRRYLPRAVRHMTIATGI